LEHLARLHAKEKAQNPCQKYRLASGSEKTPIRPPQFYVSLLPNSRIDRIARLPVDTPSGPAESVPLVDFTLAGQPYVAFTGGRLDP
jgi:3-demethylubiquinone-9 3-methyltransferase